MLFEALLALIIFSVAVVGIARALNTVISTSSTLSQERVMRMNLESFLMEIRDREIAEMNAEIADEQRGILYSAIVQEMPMTNVEGKELSDLYLLTGTATWPGSGGEQEQVSAELTIYRPRGGR